MIYLPLIHVQFIYRKYFFYFIHYYYYHHHIIIYVIIIRSRDSDIDIISSSLDKFLKDHEPPTIRKNLPKGTVLYDQDLYDRILSPSLDALDAMAKPSIYGACNSNPTASSRGCYALRFQIPEYLDLSNGDISLYELQVSLNYFYLIIFLILLSKIGLV